MDPTDLSLICQPESTPETRAVLHAALLADIPRKTLTVDSLPTWADSLRAGRAIPVGTVEYVRAAMKTADVTEPDNMSYPVCLDRYLHRSVRLRRAGDVLGTWFVKPQTTKSFTGFVFDTMTDPAALDEHDREQYDAFMALSPDAEVWISEPVKWLSEVRYYVHLGRIVGSARYDADGDDAAPMPSLVTVQAAVDDLVKATRPDLICALDMGVLSTGETASVETNDFWSIGLYAQALKPALYLEMLTTRWRQICIESRS